MIVLIKIPNAFTPLPLWVIACFYMDMKCFGLVRIVSSWLPVGSGGTDGFRWFWMVSGGLLF